LFQITDAIKILDDILGFIRLEESAQRKRGQEYPATGEDKHKEARPAYKALQSDAKKSPPTERKAYEVVFSFAGEDPRKILDTV
jgi:hypothetical protein